MVEKDGEEDGRSAYDGYRRDGGRADLRETKELKNAA